MFGIKFSLSEAKPARIVGSQIWQHSDLHSIHNLVHWCRHSSTSRDGRRKAQPSTASSIGRMESPQRPTLLVATGLRSATRPTPTVPPFS